MSNSEPALSPASKFPDWNEFSFVVQMPHLAPGEKLSEVEFLKIIAAYQWEAIARVLDRRPSLIMSDHNERLYGSVLDTELCFGAGYGQERLGEDAEVHIRNRVRFYAKKFVEGLFVFDDKPIPDERLTGVESREELPSVGLPWACMTNALIARSGGNLRLKVFKPAGDDELEIHVHARLIRRDRFTAPLTSRGYRTPFELIFRIDLYRRSDNTLMASTLVRKALNVPGGTKAVVAEAERLLHRLDARG